jgi:hypothetical protein
MLDLQSIRGLLIENYNIEAEMISIDKVNINLNNKKKFFNDIYYYYEDNSDLYLFKENGNNVILLKNTPETKLVLSDLLLILSYNFLSNQYRNKDKR